MQVRLQIWMKKFTLKLPYAGKSPLVFFLPGLPATEIVPGAKEGNSDCLTTGR